MTCPTASTIYCTTRKIGQISIAHQLWKVKLPASQWKEKGNLHSVPLFDAKLLGHTVHSLHERHTEMEGKSVFILWQEMRRERKRHALLFMFICHACCLVHEYRGVLWVNKVQTNRCLLADYLEISQSYIDFSCYSTATSTPFPPTSDANAKCNVTKTKNIARSFLLSFFQRQTVVLQLMMIHWKRLTFDVIQLIDSICVGQLIPLVTTDIGEWGCSHRQSVINAAFCPTSISHTLYLGYISVQNTYCDFPLDLTCGYNVDRQHISSFIVSWYMYIQLLS
jgi:hypothetical protein